ncbi:hypothetical protein [Mycobacterium sp. pR1184]
MTAKPLTTGLAVVAVINAMFPTVTSIAPVGQIAATTALHESGLESDGAE